MITLPTLKNNKHLFTAVLTLALSFTLAACGGSSEAPATQEPDTGAEAAQAPEETTDDSIIKFDNLVLIDDDRITVELTQFYEDEVNWVGSDAPVMEKYFTVKVTNKSDSDILFNINDGYINNESVTIMMSDGNNGPAPGKSKSYSYDIQYNTSPDRTPLESLEDLYSFEATVQTFVYTGDNTLGDERNIDISFAGAKDGSITPVTSEAKDNENAGSDAENANSSAAESSSTEKPSVQNMSVGDTVTTDNWEVTFVSTELTDEVFPPDTSGWYASVEANDGYVALDLEFDVKCTAGKARSVTDALGACRVDYANKYSYEGADRYYQWDEAHLSIANRIDVSPLETLHIYYIVWLPEEVASTSEPLTIDMMIAGEQYHITIR